jgi:uncharacterized OsmC-like protein
LDNFQIEIEASDTLDDRTREGVLAAVHKCLVHNTLLHPPRIDVQVVAPVAA